MQLKWCHEHCNAKQLCSLPKIHYQDCLTAHCSWSRWWFTIAKPSVGHLHDPAISNHDLAHVNEMIVCMLVRLQSMVLCCKISYTSTSDAVHSARYRHICINTWWIHCWREETKECWREGAHDCWHGETRECRKQLVSHRECCLGKHLRRIWGCVDSWLQSPACNHCPDRSVFVMP